jgi:subtilase family serine protease
MLWLTKKSFLVILAAVMIHMAVRINQARSDNFDRVVISRAENYIVAEEPDSLSFLRVYLLLQQNGISQLEQEAKLVSDPLSNRYRKWLDMFTINNRLSPTKLQKQELYRWLNTGSVSWVDHGDAIHLTGDIGSLEALLHTRFYLDCSGRLFHAHALSVPRTVSFVEAILLETNPRLEKLSFSVSNAVRQTYNVPPGNVSAVFIPGISLPHFGEYPVLSVCMEYTNHLLHGIPVSPVIVIPVSWNEHSYSVIILHRTNTELLKLALSGITVIVATGSTTNCNTSNFPASSPWVVSVGATNATEWQRHEGGRAIEQIPLDSTVGGFSGIFPQPWYQSNVVDRYLTTAKLPQSYEFNSSGRAYPDASILGDSTADASLVFGAAIARVVEQTGNLGLINPLLYSFADTSPGKFVRATGDVLSISGCNFYENRAKDGYWNPVIGLGAPDISAFGNYLNTLL